MADEQIMDITQQGDLLVVTPVGNLFEYRFEDLRNGYNDAYRMLCGPGIKNLLVDFEKVDHFGSAFIGMLIKLAQKARKDGGEAMLCSLSDSIQQVLKSLMLLENVNTDFFMRQFANRDEAIEFLKTV